MFLESSLNVAGIYMFLLFNSHIRTLVRRCNLWAVCNTDLLQTQILRVSYRLGRFDENNQMKSKKQKPPNRRTHFYRRQLARQMRRGINWRTKFFFGENTKKSLTRNLQTIVSLSDTAWLFKYFVPSKS